MEDIFQKLQELFGQEVDPAPYGNGHINRKYVTKGKPRLIIQQINTNVFPNPRGMMDNIIAVTEHIKPKLAAKGKDPDRATLTVIPNKNGEKLTKIGDLYFRVYYFIEDSCCYDLVSPKILEAGGKAFGEFQQMLADFPAETLFEVIPHFHDTPDRYKTFCKVLEEDVKGRAAACRDEINYYASHEAFYHTVADRLADGRLPLAVTHNDTKINNVLFDFEGNGLCVIDLDTVMPGSRLYDYGDALRTGAATAAGIAGDTDSGSVNFLPGKQIIQTAKSIVRPPGTEKFVAEPQLFAPHIVFSGTKSGNIGSIGFVGELVTLTLTYRIDHQHHEAVFRQRCRSAAVGVAIFPILTVTAEKKHCRSFAGKIFGNVEVGSHRKSRTALKNRLLDPVFFGFDDTGHCHRRQSGSFRHGKRGGDFGTDFSDIRFCIGTGLQSGDPGGTLLIDLSYSGNIILLKQCSVNGIMTVGHRFILLKL